MYKVLIAEDEMMFRMMLRSSIRWDELNLKVVSDVSNGEEGWAQVQQVMPDIIITDIRMPAMDGMEFIDKILETAKPRPKIVILSCIGDFDMVRKALTSGVSDYILKLTMTPGDMEAILVRLVNELEQEGRQCTPDSLIGYNRESRKEHAIRSCILHNPSSLNEFGKLVQELELKLDSAKSVVGALMEIESGGPIPKASICHVLDEIMAGFRIGEAFFVRDNRYFLVVNLDQSEDILPLLEHIKKVMQTFFNSNISFGISQSHTGFEGIGIAYTEAESALAQKFLRGPGSFNRFNVMESPVEQAISLLQQVEREWLLKEADRSRMFDRLRHLTSISSDGRHQIIWFLLQGLHWISFSLRMTGNTIRELVYIYSERLTTCETLEEAIALFEDYIGEIERQRSLNRMSAEVSQVMEWVEKHYRDQLNLEQAARMVNLSYNYFSALFKKEAGISFNEYLLKIRIENAKSLLLKTNKKLYDIMEEVGFADQSYFSRTFKKAVGVSPGQFKRTWLKSSRDDSGAVR